MNYIIELKEVKKFVEKRIKDGYVEKATYVSSIIKNRRIELNLTLHQTVDGICSEALLSKLERNLMKPNNEKIPLLCEKLNLDYNQIKSIDEDDLVRKMLNLLFDENYSGIKNLNYNNISDMYIVKNKIVEGYNFYINEKYEELSNVVRGLDSVKECLSDIELFALLLLITLYNIRSMQYKKAYEYFNYIKSLKLKDELVFKFTLELDFKLAAFTRKPDYKDKYKKLYDIFNDGYLLSKQFLMLLYYYQASCSIDDYHNLCKMKEEHIRDEYLEEYYYTLSLCSIRLEKYEEVIKIIEGLDNISYRFIGLYAMAIYKFSLVNSNTLKKDMLIYKKNLVDFMQKAKIKSVDTYHIAFIRLMQYELDRADDEIICNYIKNYLIKESKYFSFSLYDNYIEDRYCFLLAKLCRYKDGFYFLLEHKNNLKNKQ